MENTSISKNQRRLIFLLAIFLFFLLIFVGLTVQDDLGGTYKVDVASVNNPNEIISGTAEISHNSDNGKYYFETITLETGEIIYLYDEATPVNFEGSTEIHDDNEQFWNVQVNEQVDRLSTVDKVRITIFNIFYWTVIFTLFFILSFIKDLISVLKITKENRDNFNKLDKWAYSLGCKIERWKNSTRHSKKISISCKALSLFMALIWFLNQYNII